MNHFFKYLYYTFFSIFIFCVLFFVFPIYSNASSFTISPTDLAAINSSVESLGNLGMAQYGVVPASSDQYSAAQDISSRFTPNGKFVRYDVTQSDFTSSSSLPSNIYDSWVNGELYDVNGNVVPFGSVYLDRLRYGEFDNGYFSGTCVTFDGDIVYVLDSTQNLQRLCDVKFGGSEMTADELKSTYSSMADGVRNNLYNFGGTVGMSATYYLCFGQTRGGSPASAESVFISNQYLPGLIVPSTSNSGDSIQSWYTNDLNLIQHNQVFGSISTFTVSSGNYSKGGYNYNYYVTIGGGLGFGWVTQFGDLTSFVAGDPNQSSLCFGRTGYFYSSSLYNDSVPFLPTDGDVINLDDTYSVDDVITFPIPHGLEINPEYDPTRPVSVTNYPVAHKIDDALTGNPSISDPIEDDPTIEESDPIEVPNFDPTFISIPFITGLSKKFPFCIPFDIYSAFKAWDVEPEPPAWNFDWKIQVGSTRYIYHCEGDLSAFNELARLLRLLEMCSAFIGIAYFSYKQFF